MKLSENQLIHLLAVLKDTLRIANMNMGGLQQKDRQSLYNQIVNQQNDEVNNIEEE